MEKREDERSLSSPGSRRVLLCRWTRRMSGVSVQENASRVDEER